MTQSPLVDLVACSFASSRLAAWTALASAFAFAATRPVPGATLDQEATPEIPVDEPGFDQTFIADRRDIRVVFEYRDAKDVSKTAICWRLFLTLEESTCS